MYKRYGNKFLCFSPPVMLATFLIEFAMIFYVIWRYKMSPTVRLVTITLGLLGTFQLAEYMICGGLGLGHSDWARLGYMSITFMPAVGLHLVMTLAKKTIRPLLYAAYLMASVYAAYFATAGNALVGTTCTANYAVFHVNDIGSIIFAAYYYGWLLIGMGVATYYARRNKKVAPALRWMTVGYASFIVPTTFANIANPSTIAGIPSIMCGFAVLLAAILVWQVLPRSSPRAAVISSKKKIS